MSTALQRLLSRPLSLAFLRCLVKEPSLEHALERASQEPCIYIRHVRHRRYTATATNFLSNEPSIFEAVVNYAKDETADLKSAVDSPQHETVAPLETSKNHSLTPILDASGSPATWAPYLRTYNEVEYQSDLRTQRDDNKKLLNDPKFSKDLTLWTYLLEFRKRHYGDAGVSMFWRAIRQRGLVLATEGSIAYKLWPIFLQAGFEDKEMLHDICRYADELFDTSGKRWSDFYVYIMQHMILREKQDTIMLWHERLIERHPPDPAAFSKLARNVIMRGDLEALKVLYKTDFFKTNDIYKIYGNIIPILLKRKDFQNAVKWHFFLVHRGDHPRGSKVVGPLIQYFEIYDPWKALRIKNSLISRSVLHAASAPDGKGEPKMISREMMNVVHGKAFGIEPKTYNDSLGARWFATNWISLDFAINSIHALGVQGIGPLSLQAIALREADASGIVRRIDQLRELGISIGDSVFSNAVEYFARNGETQYLYDLLRCDQHPESYDDRQLQDNLLATYAAAEDWPHYRLTAAIQVLGSQSPRAKQYNIIQQINMLSGNRSAFFKMLEEMRVQRIPFEAKTVIHIIQHFLPHRRRRRAPNSRRKHLDDLQIAISILKTIMEFGSFIPPTVWHEIIRRLGMLGLFYDLEKLCFWLVVCYNPRSTLRSQSGKLSSQVPASQVRDLARAQFPTSHRLHPLRILFSNSLQRAIVEWAFKLNYWWRPSQPTAVLEDSVATGDVYAQGEFRCTRGVKLLRELQDQGVFISLVQIRRALRNRLVILYRPGETHVLRTKLLKQENVPSREDLVAQLNKVWGADIGLDLPDFGSRG